MQSPPSPKTSSTNITSPSRRASQTPLQHTSSRTRSRPEVVPVPHTSTSVAGPSHRRSTHLSTPATPVTVMSTSMDLSRVPTFMDILTATYSPPAPATHTPPVTAQSVSPYPPRMDSTDMIDCRPSPIDDSDSEDDGQAQNANPLAGFNRQLYVPPGDWRWASGSSIVAPEVLVKFSETPSYSITLKKGQIDGHTLHYISKSWSQEHRDRWRDFYIEAALYKSKEYLYSLQGEVVPHLIAITLDIVSVSMVMELPHSSFWIQASPSMPAMLKERVVEAYQKLHACGVLHGDAKLRHMLIGGDAKVTLINFKQCRVRNPRPELHLLQATQDDFAMEMRMVKFKLDYDGARAREAAKMERANQRADRLQVLRALIAQRKKPRLVNSEPLLPMDVSEPPVQSRAWNEEWLASFKHIPRRTIMPGQTAKQVAVAVHQLLTTVHRMEQDKEAALLSYRTPCIMSSPAPSPSPDLTPTPSPSSMEANHSQSPPPDRPSERHSRGSNSRKRRASNDAEQPGSPSKRARVSSGIAAGPSTTPPPPQVPDVLIPDVEMDLSENNTPYTRQVNIPNNSEVCVATTEYVQCGRALPTASTSASSVAQPIERDFARKPYDGPRGFYVPHPPTENRMGIERVRFVRQTNANACVDAEYDYYWADLGLVRPPSYKRVPPPRRTLNVAMGKLKRASLVAKNRQDEIVPRSPTRARYVGRSMNGHYAGAMQRWESREVVDLGGDRVHPRPLERHERRPEFPFVPGPRVRPKRGVLRVKTQGKAVSYQADAWKDEEDLLMTPWPKGPELRGVLPSYPLALLSSYVDYSQMMEGNPEMPNAKDPLVPQLYVPASVRWNKAKQMRQRLSGSRQPEASINSLQAGLSAQVPVWTPPTPPVGAEMRQTTARGREFSVTPAPEDRGLGGPSLRARGPVSRASAPRGTIQMQHRHRRRRRRAPLPRAESDSDSERDEQKVMAVLQCDVTVPAKAPLCVSSPPRSMLRSVFGWWR